MMDGQEDGKGWAVVPVLSGPGTLQHKLPRVKVPRPPELLLTRAGGSGGGWDASRGQYCCAVQAARALRGMDRGLSQAEKTLSFPTTKAGAWGTLLWRDPGRAEVAGKGSVWGCPGSEGTSCG